MKLTKNQWTVYKWLIEHTCGPDEYPRPAGKRDRFYTRRVAIGIHGWRASRADGKTRALLEQLVKKELVQRSKWGGNVYYNLTDYAGDPRAVATCRRLYDA